MLLLAGILAGGFCIWLAVKIGFYETWAMFFNIVITIYVALHLTQPIVDLLLKEAGNIPCCEALTLIILAIGAFLILHGITYVLFTSQFKVTFPKIFDVLFSGVLGFIGGYLVLSFAAIVIALTPFAKYAEIDYDSVNTSMKYPYQLFDGIHSIIRSPENEKTTEHVIEELLKKSKTDNQNKNPQQAEPDKLIKPNDA